MAVHIYIVFHVFENGTRDICGIFCKPEDAKRHCDDHPPLVGVKHFAVAKAPLWGFPWVLFITLAIWLVFLGHLL